MTTPTREQVIEWAKEAGGGLSCIAEPLEHPWKFTETELIRFATIAMSAGRDQGLRKAYDIAQRAPFKQPELDADEWESPEAAHDAGLKSMAFDITSEIRAAIEQLRGK